MEFQSTHPHGVRRSPFLSFDTLVGFNPRTHTGCDRMSSILTFEPFGFQSTHPHGVRRNGIPLRFQMFYVSIHAPTRGATLLFFLSLPGLLPFQSTHPHGVRLPSLSISGILFSFQSTHPHGVRLYSGYQQDCSYSFNPRTHTGCDRFILYLWLRLIKSFNPRTHTGCDSCI